MRPNARSLSATIALGVGTAGDVPAVWLFGRSSMESAGNLPFFSLYETVVSSVFGKQFAKSQPISGSLIEELISLIMVSTASEVNFLSFRSGRFDS